MAVEAADNGMKFSVPTIHSKSASRSTSLSPVRQSSQITEANANGFTTLHEQHYAEIAPL
jgi:hypothetical protein